MREEVLQAIYNRFVVSSVGEKQFIEIGEYVENITGSVSHAEVVGGLVSKFEFEVFLSACNMILDFISGKAKENILKEGG